MRSSFVAASILLLSAATAHAADLFIPMEPAPAPVYVDDSYDWSGVYFGVQAGGQAVNFESEYGQPGSGALAGIHAGAQTQSGNWVYGVEGDVEYSSFNTIVECGNAYCQTKIDLQGSLRGRVGYAIDSLLLYGTAGLAVARLETNWLDNDNQAVSNVDSAIRYGWTVGAGAEVALAENVLGRLEYRYTDLGARDQEYAFGDVTEDMHVTTHALRAGVSFKF
jgi:outer membrane immunogenic protein